MCRTKTATSSRTKFWPICSMSLPSCIRQTSWRCAPASPPPCQFSLWWPGARSVPTARGCGAASGRGALQIAVLQKSPWWLGDVKERFYAAAGAAIQEVGRQERGVSVRRADLTGCDAGLGLGPGGPVGEGRGHHQHHILLGCATASARLASANGPGPPWSADTGVRHASYLGIPRQATAPT
jgi:hypothetical protein